MGDHCLENVGLVPRLVISRANERTGWFESGPPRTAKRAPFFKVLFLWWEEVDSNHRSRRRQIYSLMHLATLQSAQNIKFADKRGVGVWSW